MSRGTSRVLECPRGWVWMEAGTAIDKVPLSGKKLKQSDYQKQGALPVIDQGRAFIGGYTDRAELKAPCEPPVIVFGDHTKVLKYVEVHFVAGADGVKAIKPLDAFLPKLFYYFLQAVELPEKGYARHFQFLERSSIPLPPFAEQQRIVSKIEELLTRLDAGVEALTRIKAHLKRYRQAVLKHAFEGKLTAEWREANEHQLEPASVLLESISQELQTSRGTKLVPLDTSDLPGLPGSWTWANVSRIAHLVRGVSYPKEESSKEPRHGYIPILRANNIDRELNLRQLVYVPRKRVSDEQLVKSLDILIAMSSGSRDLVGKACQASRDLEAGFGAFCGIIRVVPDMDRTYVGFFFQSPSYRNQVSRLSSGVNINNLRRDHIESMPIPLPPLSEQRHIVEEIERRFSVADNIERTVDQGLKQADRLRQSILKRAFEGKLVPQDPNDEPAAKLLERIRAEKAEQQAGTKSIKAARKKATTEEMRLR